VATAQPRPPAATAAATKASPAPTPPTRESPAPTTQARQHQAPATQPAVTQPAVTQARAAPGPARQGPRRRQDRSQDQRQRRRQRAQRPTTPLGWLSAGPLGWLAERTGVPGPAWILGAAAWVLMLALWGAGATKGGFAVFMGTLLSAAIGTALLAAAAAKQAGAKQAGARQTDVLRALRAIIVVVLSAAVPVVFDPHTGDVFNVPKYTVVVIGALVLAGLWVIASVHQRAVPRWRNGLQWIVAALVVWTAVSALAGMDVHVGLLGDYASYDGLYSAAAFGMIVMAAAEAFDVLDVRKVLGSLAFCGGAVVVVYGLIQLKDTEVKGPRWDFIAWNNGSFAHQIFSTFGNPNHLGGYLAMILPIVLVLGLGSKRRVWQVAAGLMTVAVLAELLRTSARGAWLAAIAAVAVLAIYLAPELRRRFVWWAGASAGVVAVAAAGMAVDGRHFLSHPLSTLFQSGGTSSVQQRFDIWTAAFHMVLNHPVTGIGPDAFALVYPQYQSAAWVAGLGPDYLVNGAHDIFMNVLADKGFIGLALYLALLVYVALRSAGSWRRLRRVERDESASPDAIERARLHRETLAVVTASIAAYVVQATFNVQQIGLSFVFWLSVGLLAALALNAGVPAGLSARALLSPAPAPERHQAGSSSSLGSGSAAPAKPAWANRSRARQRSLGRHPSEVPWPTVLTGVVVTAVVVLVALGADGPYRADHDYWAANASIHQTTSGSASAPTSSVKPAKPTVVGAKYFNDMAKAMSLNPWEPLYPADEATMYISAASHASSSASAVADLGQARALLAKAVSDSPLSGDYPAEEAEVEMDLARLQPSSARADLATAVSLTHEALKDNPRDPAFHSLLSAALAALHKSSA